MLYPYVRVFVFCAVSCSVFLIKQRQHLCKNRSDNQGERPSGYSRVYCPGFTYHVFNSPCRDSGPFYDLVLLCIAG